MSRRPAWIAALLAALGSAACENEDPAMATPTAGAANALPELPPLVLAEAVPQLEVLAAQAPPAPTPERMTELRDLMESAWLPNYADARTAAVAARALLDAEDVAWILEEGLAHEHAALRMQCAFQLGARGHLPALPKLAYRLKYEKDAVVQCWVVGALHRLGSHGGLDSLALLMDRVDSAQQAGVTAIEILRAVGRDPGEAPSYDLLKREIHALFRQWRRSGVVEIVAPNPPAAAAGDEVPEHAVPEDGVPEDGAPEDGAAAPRMQQVTVAASLDDMDPLLRGRLAERLASFTGTELRPVDDARFIFNRLGVVGLPLLEITLPAIEPYVRSHSLEIVRDLGRPAEPLADIVLPLMGDPLTGTTAMVALGEMGAAAAAPHLIARLDAPELELRHAAAWALGPLGDLAAHRPLLARMDDPAENMDVRVRAASSLAMLDPGLRFLEQALADGSYSHPPTLRELIDEVRERRR